MARRKPGATAMQLKTIYLLLCIVGTVVPYAVFLPWLMSNGLDIPLLVSQIASSPVTTFGWLDILISVIALFVFMWVDHRRRPVKLIWMPIVGTLLVGVSLGLPLCLLLRESTAE
jgi:uncharacterized protein DUF2834